MIDSGDRPGRTPGGSRASAPTPGRRRRRGGRRRHRRLRCAGAGTEGRAARRAQRLRRPAHRRGGALHRQLRRRRPGVHRGRGPVVDSGVRRRPVDRADVVPGARLRLRGRPEERRRRREPRRRAPRRPGGRRAPQRGRLAYARVDLDGLAEQFPDMQEGLDEIRATLAGPDVPAEVAEPATALLGGESVATDPKAYLAQLEAAAGGSGEPTGGVVSDSASADLRDLLGGALKDAVTSVTRLRGGRGPRRPPGGLPRPAQGLQHPAGRSPRSVRRRDRHVAGGADAAGRGGPGQAGRRVVLGPRRRADAGGTRLRAVPREACRAPRPARRHAPGR